MVSRTVTAIAIASMLTLQSTPKLAYAENQMGYRLLSVQEASGLPRRHGALGMDVERAQQITDGGMTFDLIRVKQVRRGSPGDRAGFRRATRSSLSTVEYFRVSRHSALMSDRCRPAAESTSITYLQGAGPRLLSAFR